MFSPARLIAVLVLCAVFPAFAQEVKKEEECTKSYIQKLEEKYRHNKKLRGWSTDAIGAACRIAEITENLGEKAAEKTKLKELWEKIPFLDRLNLRLTSQTCEYARSLIDGQISTEEDGERLRKEIQRCTGAHVIN